MMPISDPRDRFFYPHHTHMKDTYNIQGIAGQCSEGCLMYLVLLRTRYYLGQLVGFYYLRIYIPIPKCYHGHCNNGVREKIVGVALCQILY